MPSSLFNGDGREYPAHVVEAQRRHVILEIEDVRTPQRELPFALNVAAPVPKGDRAQFLVEKLTELGVHTFVPLHTERTVFTLSDAKREKLLRYVIEASKQCGRNVLMNIDERENVVAAGLPRCADENSCASRNPIPRGGVARHRKN